MDLGGCHHGTYILVEETDLNKMHKRNMYCASDNVKEKNINQGRERKRQGWGCLADNVTFRQRPEEVREPRRYRGRAFQAEGTGPQVGAHLACVRNREARVAGGEGGRQSLL